MEVFFSWSGATSKAAASALATFLEDVIQAAKPWLSEAIEKGTKWNSELDSRLERIRIGVSVLTRENQHEPWIQFEAGAIAKTKDSRLCTFLVDLKTTEVTGPLAGVQHTVPEKDDVKKLLRMINGAVKDAGGTALEDARLDKAFEAHWPALANGLEAARKISPPAKEAKRTEREMIEEILEHVRRAAQPRAGEDMLNATIREKLQALQRDLGLNPRSADAAILNAAVNVVRAAGLEVGQPAVWGQSVWGSARAGGNAEAAFTPVIGSLGHVAFATETAEAARAAVPEPRFAYANTPLDSLTPKHGEQKPAKR